MLKENGPTIKNEIANSGCFFETPDKSEIFSLYSPSFFNKYKHTLNIIYNNQEQSKKLGIKENDIDTIFENKIALLEEETVDSIKRYYNLENFFSGIFDNSDNFDYNFTTNNLCC